MNRLNITIRDIRILKYIRDYERLSMKVINLRNNFNFHSAVSIDMFDTIEDLSRFLNFKIPEWVIGTNYNNVIAVIDYLQWMDKNNELFDNLILHELVHVILGSTCKEILPVWLNEGMALYFSGQYEKYRFDRIKLDSSLNFYALDYSSENLYDISIYIFIKLINRYGVCKLIEEVQQIQNFENSSIFNNENLLSLIN